MYLEHKDGYAVKNLVDGSWYGVKRLARSVVLLTSDTETTLYVEGALVNIDDAPLVLKAIAAAPLAYEQRHSPDADAARLRAGQIAMQIQDNVIRGRLLDIVDGWTALEGAGTLLDKTGEGTLVGEFPDMRANLLLVTCPSTGRRYAMRVPQSFTKVSKARSWIMHDLKPDVET